MLKEAIRFDYSWQPNMLTTNMNVFPVGSYVGLFMIFKTLLRRMLAMKCRNRTINNCKLVSWILRQPMIRLNKGFQSIRDTPIKVHSKPKHFRLSYLNEKLQRSVGCLKRSFAAAVGVEESSLTVGNE